MTDAENPLRVCETGGPEDIGPIYKRFDKKLGTGAYKDVFLAYDTQDGRDVAWNTVKLARVSQKERERIEHETIVLGKISHPNIIKFFDVWRNDLKKEVCFTTEIVQGGTLKSFIARVYPLKIRVLKRWCYQILEALEYLHTKTPPIIHRDLKCENIFINSKESNLLIGDFGLAALRHQTCAKSVLGTPHFMAPELYDESYTEKVDVYAFGMCIIEMATNETPYTECMNAAQIFKKVYSGQPPGVLKRIKTRRIREFIELCLMPINKRLSASELKKHPFFQPNILDQKEVEVEPEKKVSSNGETSSPHVRRRSKKTGRKHSSKMSSRHIQSKLDKRVEATPLAVKAAIIEEPVKVKDVEKPKLVLQEAKAVAHEVNEEKGTATISCELRLQGPDEKSPTVQKIVFHYDLKKDTAESVSAEMVDALDLKQSAHRKLTTEVRRALSVFSKNEEEERGAMEGKKTEESDIGNEIRIGRSNTAPMTISTGKSEVKAPSMPLRRDGSVPSPLKQNLSDVESRSSDISVQNFVRPQPKKPAVLPTPHSSPSEQRDHAETRVISPVQLSRSPSGVRQPSATIPSSPVEMESENENEVSLIDDEAELDAIHQEEKEKLVEKLNEINKLLLDQLYEKHWKEKRKWAQKQTKKKFLRTVSQPNLFDKKGRLNTKPGIFLDTDEAENPISSAPTTPNTIDPIDIQTSPNPLSTGRPLTPTRIPLDQSPQTTRLDTPIKRRGFSFSSTPGKGGSARKRRPLGYMSYNGDSPTVIPLSPLNGGEVSPIESTIHSTLASLQGHHKTIDSTKIRSSTRSRAASPTILKKAAFILSLNDNKIETILRDPNLINVAKIKLKHKFKSDKSRVDLIEKAAAVLQKEVERRQATVVQLRRARTPSPSLDRSSSLRRRQESARSVRFISKTLGAERTHQKTHRGRSRSDGRTAARMNGYPLQDHRNSEVSTRSSTLNEYDKKRLKKQREEKQKREADEAEAFLLAPWLLDTSSKDKQERQKTPSGKYR